MRIDGLEVTYRTCASTGNIKEKTADTELILSIKTVAEKGLAFIQDAARAIPADSTDWTFVFRDHYEALRGLIEALMLFDGVEADNHQCKNAHVCFKHPELELDWCFLETARLKRNAINYRGHLLRLEDWQAFRLQFELHISVLRREIENRLSEQGK